jgi:hypothetical protein
MRKGGWAAMKAKKPITVESDVVRASLRYYKMHIQNYQGYPDYAFRQKQLERVEKAGQGVKELQLRGSLEK